MSKAVSAIVIILVLFYGYQQRNSGNNAEAASIQKNQSGTIFQDAPDKSKLTYKIDTNNKKVGKASWYGNEICKGKPKCNMANGQLFNEDNFTLACTNAFNLGTRFIFYYGDKTAQATCTDRGSFEALGRQFDFSKGLFFYFVPLSRGVIKLEYKVI